MAEKFLQVVLQCNLRADPHASVVCVVVVVVSGGGGGGGG